MNYLGIRFHPPTIRTGPNGQFHAFAPDPPNRSPSETLSIMIPQTLVRRKNSIFRILALDDILLREKSLLCEVVPEA
jgi:hypothetical protein